MTTTISLADPDPPRAISMPRNDAEGGESPVCRGSQATKTETAPRV